MKIELKLKNGEKKEFEMSVIRTRNIGDMHLLEFYEGTLINVCPSFAVVRENVAYLKIISL